MKKFMQKDLSKAPNFVNRALSSQVNFNSEESSVPLEPDHPML